MREIIVRPEADAYIEICADYTIGEWGHEQARKYVRELRAQSKVWRLARCAFRSMMKCIGAFAASAAGNTTSIIWHSRAASKC